MKNKRFWPILLGLVLLGLAVYLVWNYQGKNYTWQENYKDDNRGPYGTFVAFNLLKSGLSTKQVKLIQQNLPAQLPANPKERSNYVFIGDGQFLDSADVKQLLKFVKNGNNAFIASQVIPFNLMFDLYYDECDDAPWNGLKSLSDTSVYANFRHPQLKMEQGTKFTYRIKALKQGYYWDYFDNDNLCVKSESPLIPLGSFGKDRVNFVKINYGKGSFYLHSNPIMFSNLAMIKPGGREYSERAFAHLPPGPLYWDRYSKVQEEVAQNLNNGGGGLSRRLSDKSPLSYILGQPPLAWAWYVVVAIALLFLLFRVKRQQRMIPVLPSNKNTSLDFILSIGRLYFLQNNHQQLAVQKMKLLLQFIRERYALQTRDLDQGFVNLLSNKSGVSEGLILSIVNTYRAVEHASSIHEQTLIDFHRNIESFYKSCK